MGIGDTWATQLALEVIGENLLPSLSSLDLSGNNISAIGLRSLATCLVENPRVNIRNLYLAWNELDDQAICELSRIICATDILSPALRPSIALEKESMEFLAADYSKRSESLFNQ